MQTKIDPGGEVASLVRSPHTNQERHNRHTANGKTLLCAINLGPEDRKLNNAGTINGGNVIYGGLNGDVLPAFGAVVSAI